MKKGMNDIVFVWIFAAIAGAVILAFFFRFAVNQGDLMESRNAREVVYALEDKLTAFGVSEESSKAIPLNFENTFTFICDNIENSGFNKKTDKIIFAPETLDGKEIQTAIKEWKFPFPITKFYYLSNKQSRIVLVYDSNNMRQVNELKISESFNIQKQSINQFNAEKMQTESSTLDSLTLVFFANIQNKDEIFSKIKIQNLNIVQVDLNTHQIKIYTREESIDDFYLGDEMMIGSFFAPENYKCLKESAMRKLNLLSSVNEGKAILLGTKINDETCKSKLYEMQRTLNIFKTTTINNALWDNAGKIDEQNTELKKNDCSEIY